MMIDETVVARTQRRLADIGVDLSEYADPDLAANVFFGVAIGILIGTHGHKAAVDRLLHLAAGLERMASHHGGAPEC